MPPMRAGFGFGRDRRGTGSGSHCPKTLDRGWQAERSREEILAVAWRPFHVLIPILQALGWETLRGVLLSRGISKGCVAQHIFHEEEEAGREVGR